MLNDRKPLIGYLLKTFPKVSETFILNEILELERQGLDLHIFSLRSPTNEQPHPAVSQVNAPITYIPSLLPDANSETINAFVQVYLDWLNQTPQAALHALELFADRPETKDFNELWQGIYLARELQRLHIDHLHVHFANIPTATAEIAHQLCGVPFSITAHAKDIYLTDSAALDRRIAKAEFILTCTDFNRRYLQRLSTSDTPIHLAYHGIDLKRFTPQPALDEPTPVSPFAVPNSAPNFPHAEPSQAAPVQLLSVGRFCEKKGFFYLLNACRQLQEQDISFHCSIVGYGPMQAQMDAWIQDYRLESVVTLVGKLTQDQVVEQYQQADVFVLPCVVTDEGDRDGIPNVLLESMAMGVPVVSTDVSGIGELVDSGQNGLLVPERDATALAIAIGQLVNSAALRSRLGEAGQRTVHQQFTLAQNVGDVKDYLLRSLNAVAEWHQAWPDGSISGWVGGSSVATPLPQDYALSSPAYSAAPARKS